jgi:hypothetical protein
MKKQRQLDKLVDELAKGWPVEKVTFASLDSPRLLRYNSCINIHRRLDMQISSRFTIAVHVIIILATQVSITAAYRTMLTAH